MSAKRNNSIELFRFLFIAVICFMHFSNSYFGAAPYFEGAYIGTEFFFIVSGYLLMYSFTKSTDSPIKGTGAFSYTFSRVKKLYPHYLLSFGAIFVFTMIVNQASPWQVIRNLAASFWELTFLQISGLKCTGLVNYPAWYLSAMLIAGYFLYALLELFQNKFVKIGIPFTILYVYAFFSKNNGNMDVWGGAQIMQVSDAVIRAFAAMSIGILCYQGAEILRIRTISINGKIALTIAEIASYITVLIMSTVRGHSQNDFYLLALLGIAVVLSFSGQTLTGYLCNNRVVSYLGKISFPMFLNQIFIIGLFGQFYTGQNYKASLLLFIVAVMIYAAVADAIINLIYKVTGKGKHKQSI